MTRKELAPHFGGGGSLGSCNKIQYSLSSLLECWKDYEENK